MKNAAFSLPAQSGRKARYSVRKQLTLASFAALGLFSTARSSFGAADTFIATAPDPASYATPANWSLGTVPTASDDAIFDYSLGTTTTIVGLDTTSALANSLQFGTGGGLTNPFTLRANSGAVTTARALTLTTSSISFAAGNSAGVTIGGGTNGVLTLSSNANALQFVNGNTALTETISAVLANNSAATSTASVVSYSGGTFVLGGTNTYSGSTNIGANTTVRIANTKAFGTAPTGSTINLNGATTVLQLGGLALPVSAASSIANSVIENAATANGSINFTQGGTLAGILRDGTSGTGTNGTLSLIKNTGGTALVLTGNNTYTGTTTITGGTLQVGSNGTTGTLGTATSIDDNGTLSYFRSDAITVGQTITNTTTTAPNIAGRLSISGSTSGGVTVTGANSFQGFTQIQSGTGTGSSALLTVSSINSVATNATTGTVHSTTSNLGAPTTAANGIIQLGANNQGGILRYVGAGETTDRQLNILTGGTNPTTGVQQDGVTSGTLTFTSSPISSTLNTGSNKVLTLQGTGNGSFTAPITDNIGTDTVTINPFTAGTTTITATFAGNIRFDGAISGTFANGANTIAAGATGGALVTGNSGLAVGTTVTAIPNGVVAGTGTNATTTFTYTLSTATTGSSGSSTVTFASNDTIGVTKAGTGTWALTNASGSTNTGAVAINAGTLSVSNTSGSGTGSGAVTLGTGTTGSVVATLASGAVGIVTGTVTTNSAARSNISPGGAGSVGMLTLNTLTTTAGSTFTFDLGATGSGSTATASGSDLLSLTALSAATTGTGSLVFNLTAASGAAGKYDLLNYTSATGLDTGDLVATGFTNGSFQLNPNAATGGMEIDFVVTAVPEPSSWVGASVLVGFLAWAKRKRQSGNRSSAGI